MSTIGISTSSKMSSSSTSPSSSSTNPRIMVQQTYQSASCDGNQYGSYQSKVNLNQPSPNMNQSSPNPNLNQPNPNTNLNQPSPNTNMNQPSPNTNMNQSGGSYRQVGMVVSDGTVVGRKDSRNETILSGQFMVSEISEERELGVQVGSDEGDHEYNSDYGEGSVGVNPSVISPISPDVKSMELTTECKETMFEYQGKRGVHSVTIDKSLSRLFHCMSLAYSGKLTSPKWKSFKGLRLKLKDKIRLNNIIWRAWHMQYIKGRDKPPFFQFATSYDVHNKPEAILLEGKYWKRGSGTVVAEYRKWRSFNHKTKSNNARFIHSHDSENKGQNMTIEYYPSDGTGMMSSLDDDFMDFTDNLLFNSLCNSGGNNYLEFPNPREIAQSGFGADCIQPGLTQLQPPMDNYMDITFEPFQEFMSRTLSVLPPLMEEPQVQLDQTGQQHQSCGMYQQAQQSLFNTSPYSSFGMSQGGNQSMGQGGNQSMGQSGNQSMDQSMGQSGNQSMGQGGNERTQGGTMYSQPSTSSEEASTVPQFKSITTPVSDVSSIRLTPIEVYNAYQQPQDQNCGLVNVSKQESGVQEVSNPNTFIMPSAPIASKMTRMSIRSNRNNGTTIQSNDVQQQQNSSVLMYQNQNSNSNQYSGFQSQQQTGPIAQPQSFNPSVDASSNQYAVTTGGAVSTSSNQLPNQAPFESSNQLQSPSNVITSNNIIAQLLQSSPNPNISIINQLQQQRHLPSNPPSSVVTGFNGKVSSRFSPINDTSRLHLTGTSSGRHGVRFDPSTIRTVAPPRSEGMTSSVDDISFIGSSRHRSMDGATSGGGPVRKISSPASICSPHPLAAISSPGSSSRRTREVSPLPLTLSHSSSLGALSSPSSSHHHRRHGSVSPGHSSTNPGHTSPGHHHHSLPGHGHGHGQGPSGERQQHREHRRVSHINAEQKRRCNIKNGFDTLRSILPSMSGSTASTSSAPQKVSKATMLNKAADYIQQLKSEQSNSKRVSEGLRSEIALLAQQIRQFQDQLPATGAPVSSINRSVESRQQFELYVRERTRQNWKFWVFSLFVEPLFESFEANVSTRTVDDMKNTMLSWLDSSCSLMTLRRDVQDSLVHLSTTSSILTDPSLLPREAVQTVNERVANSAYASNHHSN